MEAVGGEDDTTSFQRTFLLRVAARDKPRDGQEEIPVSNSLIMVLTYLFKMHSTAQIIFLSLIAC